MAFWNVSLETANQFYTWGWRASIFGALITFFGVGFLYWGTRVRDRDFESQIAILHNRAAVSEERSQILAKETAALTASNLEVATNLERERAARARIEAGLASRHIRPEQKAAIGDALRGASFSVVISVLSDPEALTYAGEISSALAEAGITVQKGSTVLSGGDQGLFIESAAQRPLLDAFKAAGIRFEQLPEARNDMLKTGLGLNAIYVAAKPIPF